MTNWCAQNIMQYQKVIYIKLYIVFPYQEIHRTRKWYRIWWLIYSDEFRVFVEYVILHLALSEVTSDRTLM